MTFQMKDKTSSTLSLIFETIGLSLKKENLTVSDFFQDLGERSHAIVIFVFSLPFLTPFPIPGLSILFGAVIMFSSFAMIFNIPIKVPHYLGKRSISSHKMASAIAYISKYLWRVEKLIHPRGEYLIQHFLGRTFFCLLIFFSGFILALPLPPGTNFPPAFVCLILAIALLEKDFLLAIIGTIGFITMTFLFSSLSQYVINLILKYADFFRL